MSKRFDNVRRFVASVASFVSTSLLHVVTAPYYRWFEYNTLGPMRRVAAYNKDADKFPRLLVVLTKWRERKMSELQFTSIACTVLSGAVIGSFSWNNVDEAFWLAPACWYCTLVFGVLGILLSAQQVAVLTLLGNIPKDPSSNTTMIIVDRYLPLFVSGAKRLTGSREGQRGIAFAGLSKPKWLMVFTWQCPVMFMSYSVCTFLLGLTLLIVTPLIHLRDEPWSHNATVALIYLVVAVLSGIAFVTSSFLIYHHVELDPETLMDQEEEADDAVQVRMHKAAVAATSRI